MVMVESIETFPKFFYVDDGNGTIATTNLTGKMRAVEDNILNFNYENARLAVRIAKNNLERDPKNKYYSDILADDEERLKDAKLRKEGVRVGYVVDIARDINDPTATPIAICESGSVARAKVELLENKFGTGFNIKVMRVENVY